ncbi:MAG TPA: serine hydrolase domain-containing protein [Kofleriaceae bacterium]|nr:serine hydrolase domain-containing protein [Kofleriaceae bacterium]
MHARADDALEQRLAQVLADAITAQVCSAAAAACGEGEPDDRRARTWYAGRTRAWPTPGPPIVPASPFDLASLTKPMATALVAMRLVTDGRLDLDARAARWLPALPPSITIAHLLGHASGLPGHRELFRRIWAGDLGGAGDPRAALVAMAAATPPERAPGEATDYSDLGYVVLGAALEAIGGAPLEALTADAHRALGLEATTFVDLRPPHAAAPVVFAAPPVATEHDARRGLVAGEVHDENCHAAGGIAGHAGLFAPLADVARFAALLASAPRTGAPGIGASVAARFFTSAAAPATSWRLGWDTPSARPGVSHAGDAWPRAAAVGHLGFTGTSLWLDWARGRWCVLLSNRVHPDRARPEAAGIKQLRRTVGDLAWALLERGS